MPPKYVKTVEDLIYWEYAKLIARAAGFAENYGFIVSRYKKLKSGEMEWSSSIRDREKEWEKGKVCAYCGATHGLTIDHIVPVCRGCVDPRVLSLLESEDNAVWACRTCNTQKRDRDVFEWYGKERRDEIPKLVLSKFLKLAYRLHETQGTLKMQDPNMDGALNIYDLGVVITALVRKLSETTGEQKPGPGRRPRKPKERTAEAAPRSAGKSATG